MQETHIIDENLIKMDWNMSYVTSCISTQSAGVLTLFDNSFACLESHKDNSGRMAIVVLEKGNDKLIVVNLYVPCDPLHAMEFMEMVYDKLYLVMDEHADAFLIMGGDFNACMCANSDSLNRTKTLNEIKSTEFIESNKWDLYRCSCYDASPRLNNTPSLTKEGGVRI